MNSSNSPEDLGNADTKSSSKKKQPSAYSNWVFNIHFGPDKQWECYEDWIEMIKKKRDYFKLYRFAEEYGKKGETPHVQGAVILKIRKRLTAMKKILGDKTVHLDVMKGDWEDQEYCGKEGYGLLTNDRKIRRISKNMLWEWQKECVSWFEDYCDVFDRKVHWIRGDCQGKSMVCKYLIDNEECIVVEGKNTDILYGIAEYVKCHLNSPKIVIVDIPKVNCGAVSYQALEKIKNGFFFNAKYESGMCRFDPPHILVMSNDFPDLDNFIHDRWQIYEVINKELTKKEINEIGCTDEVSESDYDF